MASRDESAIPWLITLGAQDGRMVVELPFTEETADVEQAIAYLRLHYPTTLGLSVLGIYRPRTMVRMFG